MWLVTLSRQEDSRPLSGAERGQEITTRPAETRRTPSGHAGRHGGDFPERRSRLNQNARQATLTLQPARHMS